MLAHRLAHAAVHAADAAEPAEDGQSAAAGRAACWRRVHVLAQQAAGLVDQGVVADEEAAQQLESLGRLMGLQGA